MRTPRDSTYARVAAGGDYDADWEEHYAPPPPPNLKRAAQAPKKIATVGAAGPDRWARDDYYTARVSEASYELVEIRNTKA